MIGAGSRHLALACAYRARGGRHSRRTNIRTRTPTSCKSYFSSRLKQTLGISAISAVYSSFGANSSSASPRRGVHMSGRLCRTCHCTVAAISGDRRYAADRLDEGRRSSAILRVRPRLQRKAIAQDLRLKMVTSHSNSRNRVVRCMLSSREQQMLEPIPLHAITMNRLIGTAFSRMHMEAGRPRTDHRLFNLRLGSEVLATSTDTNSFGRMFDGPHQRRDHLLDGYQSQSFRCLTGSR